jgi:hypothetical protein
MAHMTQEEWDASVIYRSGPSLEQERIERHNRERELFRRIQRILAKDKQKLRITRGNGNAFQNLGRYYIEEDGVVVAHHCEMEQLARELGITVKAAA